MERDVIILTKSDKFNNYCVAGIERYSGQWIRLENKEINALSEDDMRYADGSVCQILDIVRVDCFTYPSELNFQPENVYINPARRFRKLGRTTWAAVIEKHPPEVRKAVLVSRGDSFLPAYYVANYLRSYRSLQLIEVTDLVIERSEWNQEQRRWKHPKARFSYRALGGDILNYHLTVTDGDYTPCETERRINHAYLIVSLGVEYRNNHYLLIAKII